MASLPAADQWYGTIADYVEHKTAVSANGKVPKADLVEKIYFPFDTIY